MFRAVRILIRSCTGRVTKEPWFGCEGHKAMFTYPPLPRDDPAIPCCSRSVWTTHFVVLTTTLVHLRNVTFKTVQHWQLHCEALLPWKRIRNPSDAGRSDRVTIALRRYVLPVSLWRIIVWRLARGCPIANNRELRSKKKNTTGWRILTRLTHPVTGIPRIKGQPSATAGPIVGGYWLVRSRAVL